MKYEKEINGSETSEFVHEIKKKFNLSEVMARIIAKKGFASLEEVDLFLYPKKSQFEDPFRLKGMTELVSRVKQAAQNNEKVLVFGDYDVDGIGATAIMLGALTKMGIDASYILPSRYIDGYGLTIDLINKIKQEINPSLIITVDCGISSHDEVEHAKTLGMEVIVTDHHEIPSQLPKCNIVTAKFTDQAFSFHDLCGAGVALKIAQALLGMAEAEEFLPVAAISTIADMVSLTQENRAIVHFGLLLFPQHLPIGLKQFFKHNKMDIKKVLTTDISFRIAPKLNSPGRMGNAEDALQLYLEKDIVKINQIIKTIIAHNDERVALCNRIHAECKVMLETLDMQQNLCVVLSSKTWDQGVLGIICSRLVEELSRPVFLFSELGNEMKGSGRSVDGINIHEMLSTFDGCIEKFGGHAMAAGLTIKASEISNFKRQANAYIASKSQEIVFSKTATYDEKITPNEISSKLASELDLLEPTGMGNNLPVFLVESNNLGLTPLKNFPEHLNISIGKNFVGIYFDGSQYVKELSIVGTKSFLIEIQRPKYKTRQVRGQVKEFSITSVSKSSFQTVVAKSLIFELEHFNTSVALPNSVKKYNPNTLQTVLSSCMQNPFGTVIVSSSYDSFEKLKQTFNLESIRHSYFLVNAKSLLNCVLIAPTSLNGLEKFSNIVLLDGVSSNGYLQVLANHTAANIHLPEAKSVDCTAFLGLKTNRVFMGSLYNAFKKHENKPYASKNELAEYIASETKTTPENAMLAFLIFKEIGVLKQNLLPDGNISINKTENKGDLEQSKIAAFVRENANPLNGDCK